MEPPQSESPREASDNKPDIDALLEALRARVEKRRKDGEFPPGLEEDLEAHFRRILATRSPDFDRLRQHISEAYDAMGFDPDALSYSSRVPGGKLIHKLVAKITARQRQGILDQVSTFAHAVYLSMSTMEEHNRLLRADIINLMNTILERLASYERTPGDGDVALRELNRRVESLEEADRSRSFSPWFTNEEFEAAFRGSPEELKERYSDLADHFAGLSPVIDIGCGRGEFIELLHARGVEASGVEIDGRLAEAARERGLKVEVGDGVRHLGRIPDESLGGIVLIQVVEHFRPQQLVDLVPLAYDKLSVGGKLLIETINPQSLYTYAHSYAIDPSHVVPVHPAYLTFLVNQAGFSNFNIFWRSPPPQEDIPREVPESDALTKTINENTRRLNTLLHAAQDYALIATRTQ